MKTVIDVWVLRSGGYFETFGKKTDAMLQLADVSFLDEFPDNTVFTLQPGYIVVDYKAPKKYKKNKPKKPKLLTKG